MQQMRYKEWILNENLFLNFKFIKGLQNEVCKTKEENTQNSLT